MASNVWRKLRRKGLASVAAFALVAVFTPAVAASASTGGCPDLDIITVRGSGEAPFETNPSQFESKDLYQGLRESGWAGQNIFPAGSNGGVFGSGVGSRLPYILGGFGYYYEKLHPDAQIYVDPLNYPAAAALSAVYGEFEGSLEAGRRTLVAKLTALLTCHEAVGTKVVLTGYSQGAMVIHRALAFLANENMSAPEISSDFIAGIALLADPFTKVGRAGDTLGSSTSVFGQPSKGDGLLTDIVPVPIDIPDALLSRTLSYCDQDDLFCDPGLDAAMFFDYRTLTHGDYGFGYGSGISGDPLAGASIGYDLAMILEKGDEQIPITNPALRACLAKYQGGIPWGQTSATRSQLANVRYLDDCGRSGILYTPANDNGDWSPLRYAVGLQTLLVNSDTINLEELKDIPSLSNLHFQYSQGYLSRHPDFDLSKLPHMLHLESLSVDGYGITNLDGLRWFTVSNLRFKHIGDSLYAKPIRTFNVHSRFDAEQWEVGSNNWPISVNTEVPFRTLNEFAASAPANLNVWEYSAVKGSVNWDNKIIWNSTGPGTLSFYDSLPLHVQEGGSTSFWVEVNGYVMQKSLQPQIGDVKRQASGYTGQITNFDPAFQFSANVSSTDSTTTPNVKISDTGKITVSGATPGSMTYIDIYAWHPGTYQKKLNYGASAYQMAAPQVNAASSTAAALSWIEPTGYSNSQITDYVVQYRPKGVYTWRTYRDGTSNSLGARLNWLNSGATYEFRVGAVTDQKTIFSETAAATLAVAPSQVRSLSARSNATKTASVSWAAPKSLGGAASATYKVQVRFGADVQTFYTGNLSLAVAGLTSKKSYQVTVAACNDVGCGLLATTNLRIK